MFLFLLERERLKENNRFVNNKKSIYYYLKHKEHKKGCVFFFFLFKIATIKTIKYLNFVFFMLLQSKYLKKIFFLVLKATQNKSQQTKTSKCRHQKLLYENKHVLQFNTFHVRFSL